MLGSAQEVEHSMVVRGMGVIDAVVNNEPKSADMPAAMVECEFPCAEWRLAQAGRAKDLERKA